MARANPKAPTPKPRWERKAHERPEALFQAALESFAERGYRATRLEEVAEAAGVSKGTIYRYFKTKEDLLEQSLNHRRRIMLSATEEALDNFQGTASDKLGFFLGRCWAKCMDKDWGRFHTLLFGEIALELPDLFEAWAKQSMVAAWKMLESILREGQRSGEFRADADVKALARTLYSGLSHQAWLRLHMGFEKFDPMPTERIFTATLDLAVRGLRAEPSGAIAAPGIKVSGKKKSAGKKP